MVQYQVDEEQPELLDAVRKLMELAGPGSIHINKVTVVETEIQSVVDILNVMLGPGRIGAKQDFLMTPNEAREKEGLPPLTRHPGIVTTGKNGGGEKTVVVKGPKRPPVSHGMLPANHKYCVICGEEFKAKRGGGKICGKPECKRALTKKYNQSYLSKRKIQSVVPVMEVPANAPAGPLAGDHHGSE